MDDATSDAPAGGGGWAFPLGWAAAVFANLWGALVLAELIGGPPEGVTNDGYPFVFCWWLPLLGIAMLIGVVGGVAALQSGAGRKGWAIALIVVSLAPAIAFGGLLIVSAVTGAF